MHLHDKAAGRREGRKVQICALGQVVATSSQQPDKQGPRKHVWTRQITSRSGCTCGTWFLVFCSEVECCCLVKLTWHGQKPRPNRTGGPQEACPALPQMMMALVMVMVMLEHVEDEGLGGW